MRLGKAKQETGLALLSAFTIFVIQKTGDWEVWEMQFFDTVIKTFSPPYLRLTLKPLCKS